MKSVHNQGDHLCCSCCSPHLCVYMIFLCIALVHLLRHITRRHCSGCRSRVQKSGQVVNDVGIAARLLSEFCRTVENCINGCWNPTCLLDLVCDGGCCEPEGVS